MYGCDRQANVTAPNPVIIHGMQEMTHFVHTFYAEKVASLQQLSNKAAAAAAAAAAAPSKEPLKDATTTDGKKSQHQGAGSDDEDEDKKKFKDIVNEVAAE